MKRWANEEGAAGRNHHGAGGSTRARAGISMGVAAGAAVTGHSPRGSAVSAGKPVMKKTPNATAATATATATAAAPVRKTASALSAVADRRGRFGA